MKQSEQHCHRWNFWQFITDLILCKSVTTSIPPIVCLWPWGSKVIHMLSCGSITQCCVLKFISFRLQVHVVKDWMLVTGARFQTLITASCSPGRDVSANAARAWSLLRRVKPLQIHPTRHRLCWAEASGRVYNTEKAKWCFQKDQHIT